MARGCVCEGRIVDVEEQKYTPQNGSRAGEEQTTLRFHLDHPAIRAIGSVQFEARSDVNVEAVRKAVADGYEVQVIAQPRCIRSEKTDDYGRPRDFAVMVAASVSPL